jgi:hypothetical protein
LYDIILENVLSLQYVTRHQRITGKDGESQPFLAMRWKPLLMLILSSNSSKPAFENGIPRC